MDLSALMNRLPKKPLRFVRWLALCSAVVPLGAPQPSTASNQRDAIFVHVPGSPPLAAAVEYGRVVLRTAEYVQSGYRLNGVTYCLDWDLAKQRLQRSTITAQLQIQSGSLVWQDKLIRLADGLQVRNIWEAVQYRGWIVALGRTSRTDREAALTPPYFATEAIYFKEGSGSAHRSEPLGAFPAGDLSLLILSECVLAER